MNSAGPVVAAGTVNIRHIAAKQGLEVTMLGVVQSPLIDISEVGPVIDLVANVSKEAAHYLLDHYRPRPRRGVRDVLEELLCRRFRNQWGREIPWIGHSNKPHKFDYDIRLSRDRHLLMDVVSPEPSSIDSPIVSHVDLGQAELPNVFQRIIYDDGMDWRAADLSLLSVGAPPVPISAAPDVFERLAA